MNMNDDPRALQRAQNAETQRIRCANRGSLEEEYNHRRARFNSAILSAVPPFPTLFLLQLAEELHQQCDSAACMLASAISFSLQLT
jgi:hypothetical protein